MSITEGIARLALEALESGNVLWQVDAIQALKEALAMPQPEGDVVVTKNHKGQIVAVTRQNEEGQVLSIIAESSSSPQPVRICPIKDAACCEGPQCNVCPEPIRPQPVAAILVGPDGRGVATGTRIEPVAVQEALRAFARAAVSICDSAAQGYKADSHPFNDKFGDAPEKLIAAETKATTCRELSWKIRQEAEKHLLTALAATQQGVNHE